MTLHISEAEVRAVLTMPLAVEAVEEISRKQATGEVVVHPRRRFELPGGGFFHYMAAADFSAGFVAMKQYTFVRGKLRFLVPLYEMVTGDLLALIEADYMGQLRTGAASGVATKYLARKNARVAAIIGTGGQAKTQLEAAKVQARDITLRRAQFEHAIAVLLGKPPASFTLNDAPLDARPPAIPTGLPSELLERRPDIAAAERRVAEANDRIGIARAAFYPTISLNGTVGIEATSFANLFNPASLVWSLGPTLSQTVFDAGRRASVSEEANARYDETVADYRQTTLTAFQQVEDNLVALRVLQQEAENQHQATLAAQSAEQIFNNRYVGGLDTYLQVVTAQTTALNNERNDIDIMRRQMDASVLLIKALGGGWNVTDLPKL